MKERVHKWSRFFGQSKLDRRHGTIGRTLCGYPVGKDWKETTKKSSCPKCNDGNRLMTRVEETRVRS
jgi:rubredoxin